MILKKNELKHVSRFIIEEVPRSIGMSYISGKVKSCFDINQEDDIWRFRKKEQEKK